MPRDESAVWVIVRLGEGVAESGLGSKIHIAEQELAYEICGNRGRFGLLVGIYYGESAVIKEPNGERAEV